MRNTAETCMRPQGAHLITEAVQGVGKSTIQSGYAETRACRCQGMTKDVEQFITCAKTVRTKRSQLKRLTQKDQKSSIFIASDQ